MLSVFLTFKMNHGQVLNYRNDRLANKSSKNDRRISNYIDKQVKKVKSQLKANLFDKNDRISIIGFGPIFKLACNTNRIRESAAMYVLPYYINGTLANAIHSHTCIEGKSTLITTSARNNEARSRFIQS